jgi:hypothetical protein
MEAHETQLVGTLTDAGYKAEIFSTNMPGEFKVIYQNPHGEHLEEAPLTGISSYKQRQNEILEHLHKLAHGEALPQVPDLGDSGEY